MLQQALTLIRDPNTEYAAHSWQYISLCLTAVLLAIVVGVPLGVLVARRPLASFLATNTSGLVRAIPSIVFLVLFIPYLGLGYRPAVFALTILGVPPILLNTIAGLRGLDPAAIDAARGMGMTPWQVLARIQIPLVLPVAAAGVRTAAVQIVATGTLAGVFGAGGWGEYIYLGIFRGGDLSYILIGAVPVMLLALAVELGLGAAERALTPAGLRVRVAATAVAAP